jgi:hypothetical protein
LLFFKTKIDCERQIAQSIFRFFAQQKSLLAEANLVLIPCSGSPFQI